MSSIFPFNPVYRSRRWLFLLLVYLQGFTSTGHGDGNLANSESLDLRCERCNVLFLNFDFLRADYVGLLNGTDFTPNIDRFFGNSIIFEDVSSPAGSSYRGNLSVMTATEPHIYDIDVGSFNLLKASQNLGPWKQVYAGNPTIAQTLSKAGYQTINLNKGIRSGRGTFLDRGFDRYRQFDLRRVIEDLLPWLHQDLMSARRPFFLLFHPVPTRLHRAFYPLGRPRILDEDIIYREYSIDNAPYGYKVIRNRKPSLQRQRAAEHKIYGQQLRYADEEMVDTFALLQDRVDDTIIVLYSNHGTQLGDKGIFASNGVSYQSCVRVPLLIRHPAVSKPIRVSTPVSLVDLVPTIHDFVSVKNPLQSNGQSLVPLIKGSDYERRYLIGKNDHDEYIRAGDWKLIVHYERDRALYNLRNDPLQRINVLDAHRGIARRLQYLTNFGQEMDEPITAGNWKLVVRDTKVFELYNLESDPEETSNLADANPRIRESLSTRLEQFKLRARRHIRDMADF